MVYFGSKPRSRRGEKREKKDDYNDDEDGGKVCTVTDSFALLADSFAFYFIA